MEFFSLNVEKYSKINKYKNKYKNKLMYAVNLDAGYPIAPKQTCLFIFVYTPES